MLLVKYLNVIGQITFKHLIGQNTVLCFVQGDVTGHEYCPWVLSSSGQHKNIIPILQM